MTSRERPAGWVMQFSFRKALQVTGITMPPLRLQPPVPPQDRSHSEPVPADCFTEECKKPPQIAKKRLGEREREGKRARKGGGGAINHGVIFVFVHTTPVINDTALQGLSAHLIGEHRSSLTWHTEVEPVTHPLTPTAPTLPPSKDIGGGQAEVIPHPYNPSSSPPVLPYLNLDSSHDSIKALPLE